MPDKVRDPVCGMEIDPKQATASIQHEGQTFYFCSPACKGAFEKNPSRYLSQ